MGQQTEVISDKAFLPVKEKISDSGTYAVTVTSAGNPTPTPVIDITLTTTQLTQLQAITEDTWKANKYNSIAAGGVQGQRGISSDYKWRYECWGNGNWSRDLVINYVYEVYIGTVDDSASDFDPSSLLTLFPNAVTGQRVTGSGNWYWEKMSTYWMCVKNAGDMKGVAVTDATDATDVITQFNALLASLRGSGILGE